MAHYIDADRLRAEIDKRYAEYRAKMKTDDFTYYEGMADALDLFEQFLDTLLEQPVKGLDEAAENIYKTPFGTRAEDFIAGAEWQYQKDQCEFAKLKAKEWINGFDDGYAKGLNARKEK